MDFGQLWTLVNCVFRHFTDRALTVLAVAGKEAAARHQQLVTAEHVLLALANVERGPGRVCLECLGIDLQQHAACIAALVDQTPSQTSTDHPAFSPIVERLLAEARAESQELGHNYVGTEHLVLGLLRCGTCPAGAYLREHGVTIENLRAEALRLLGLPPQG